MSKSPDEVTNLKPKLTQWISRLLRRSSNDGTAIPSATLIPRDQHTISRRDISEAALKVIARLRSAGYKGFLVGGGVRDLLLGLHPKDFDVATDATPEQVRELFRNSRIIGRRFKIVHVRFGREIIEVTTFRGGHNGEDKNPDQSVNDHGMLLRDNVFGSVEEDAIRRDFTINALYYTTEDFAVHDYVNGMADLKARQIRMIGDPTTRYREDPVRMLRAVRFAAKLGFRIEANTAAPIAELRHLLQAVPAARMFDEVLKLLMAGHGEATYELLCQYDLFAPLFPASAAALEAGHPTGDALIRAALASTDRRVRSDKPVTPAFIYAALLWPALEMRLQELLAQGVPELPALQQAATEVIEDQQRYVALPRRFAVPVREIWELQQRLPRRNPRRVLNLLENRRLRAGYDFLLLREQTGEDLGGLGAWWTEFLDADDDHRAIMLRKLAPSPGGRRRRRRKSR